jgi:hypothetical protein
MVEHALGREAVVAVALDLVAEGADLLAVADIAALADVDVAAGELEWRVGPHALHALDRRFDREQRDDLHQAADRHGDQGQDREQDDVALDGSVAEGHDRYSAATARTRAGSASGSARSALVAVRHRL